MIEDDIALALSIHEGNGAEYLTMGNRLMIFRNLVIGMRLPVDLEWKTCDEEAIGTGHGDPAKAETVILRLPK